MSDLMENVGFRVKKKFVVIFWLFSVTVWSFFVIFGLFSRKKVVSAHF